MSTTYNRYSSGCDLDSELLDDITRHQTDLAEAIAYYRSGRMTFGQLTYELKRLGGALEEAGEHADQLRSTPADQDSYLATDHNLRIG